MGILSAYLAVQWADLNNDDIIRDEIDTLNEDALSRARNVYAATAVSGITANACMQHNVTRIDGMTSKASLLPFLLPPSPLFVISS